MQWLQTNLLKVDCHVFCIFSLNLVFDLPTWFLSSNSLRRKRILRGPLVRVVARRSASVVRHGVDYCCVKKGSQFDCCVFFVFFSQLIRGGLRLDFWAAIRSDECDFCVPPRPCCCAAFRVGLEAPR